jgi:NADPH:quinone reductase-like Zn-dependent oxidoreductase
VAAPIPPAAPLTSAIENHQQNVREILTLLETRAVKPRVDRIVPLARAIEAFQLFERNKGRGNTVVCIREE